MADGPNRPNRPIRPRGGGPGGRRRRVVIEGGSARGRDARAARDRSAAAPPRAPAPPPATGPVTVESGVTVKDLSAALGVTMAQIIKTLMGLGQMRTATQSLTDDEVMLIATEVEREVTIKHAADDEEPEIVDDADADLSARPPVVTIMGHVDHGKTTLLDAIRKAAVVETEAGGITQHIGAYQTEIDGRKLTFLDTPGHEAFTAMRARGAKVTDIAVLVVAADDGVMPQTKESINHARAAEVPIVVAINKIDVADANTDRVKTELAAEGLQPEDWGGDTQFAAVSAREQTNLPELLEKILLVADAELDLRANAKAEASGPIVESRLDVGRGPVATMLVQRGTLRVGDAIVAGDAAGKVRALYDYRGEKVREAGPGRARRDPRLRPPAARRRALAGRRARAPGEGHRREARRAAPARAARAALDGRRRLAGDALRADAVGRRAGPQRRAQGRRPGLRRGARQRARQDPAPRGARQRDPHGCRRDHRERRQPRVGLERARRRVQRPPERRGESSSPSARASTSAPTASSTS